MSRSRTHTFVSTGTVIGVSTQQRPVSGPVTEQIPAIRDYPTGPTPALPPLTKQDYLLRGGGMLAVAVVTGMLWYLTHADTPPPSKDAAPSQPSAPQTKYTYQTLTGPVTESECSTHATGKVKASFVASPCTQMTRYIYSTTVNGTTIYSAMSVVTMPTADQAAALDSLVQQDNTGNVKDLIADKKYTIDGLARPAYGLSGGGFKSTHNGNTVTIVESFDLKKQLPTQTTLKDVSADALLIKA
jgi:hypothetical protein